MADGVRDGVRQGAQPSPQPVSASSSEAAGDYPGRRLGLPEQGPGSVGRPGRRLVALLVDWLLSLLIAEVAFRHHGDATLQWAPLGVFTLLNVVLLSTVGGTVGHRLLGLKAVRLDGSAPGFGRSVVRAVLLSLAIPALIWDRDQRGMHDRFAGTVLRRV